MKVGTPLQFTDSSTGIYLINRYSEIAFEIYDQFWQTLDHRIMLAFNAL